MRCEWCGCDKEKIKNSGESMGLKLGFSEISFCVRIYCDADVCEDCLVSEAFEICDRYRRDGKYRETLERI